MTTESDLRQAVETSFVHCRPGGVVLFCPDYIREHFEAAAEHSGEDDGPRGMRWLSWQRQRNPNDTTYFVDYAYLLARWATARFVSSTTGISRVCSRATPGSAPSARWGWSPRALPFEHSDLEPGKHEVFVGVRPEASQQWGSDLIEVLSQASSSK